MAKEEIGGCIALVIIITIVSEIVKFIQKYFVYLIYVGICVVGIFIFLNVIGKIRNLPPRRKVIKIKQPYKNDMKPYLKQIDRDFKNWDRNEK